MSTEKVLRSEQTDYLGESQNCKQEDAARSDSPCENDKFINNRFSKLEGNGAKQGHIYGSCQSQGEKGVTDDSVRKNKGEHTQHHAKGMETAIGHLYAGKHDAMGHFEWQEKISQDLKQPVENDETARKALLVRNTTVHNDSERVTSIHSIVVQSPPLKEILNEVLENYPGVTVDLSRLEFQGKLEPLIHRLPNLQDVITRLGNQTEVERISKSHAELLRDLLIEEYGSMIETTEEMKGKRVMSFDHLWTLFEPGTIVCAKQDGRELAMELIEARYARNANGVPHFWLQCMYIDWNGVHFGSNEINFSVATYDGVHSITTLEVYPIEFHSEGEAVRARLIGRGTKIENLTGRHYVAYKGHAWRERGFGKKDMYNVDGRIMIDTEGWNRFNPAQKVSVTLLSQKGSATTSCLTVGESKFQLVDGCDISMPIDGPVADAGDAAKRVPLTTEQKLICSPTLRGYSLENKLWLNFDVDCVEAIEWQTNTLDRLVLPEQQKRLILTLTQSQRKYRNSFDDIIEGKGKGMIVLLYGPPGVGKTLTSESVAEEMRVPLYTLSAQDIVHDPQDTERRLRDILQMCSQWDAVLVLDEADVFLERRAPQNERNNVVSILLRVFEYYQGIMFLTTNRIENFDPAFQSRIHVSLKYSDLTLESRSKVWRGFLDASFPGHTISDTEIMKLSDRAQNGRQIKNILKSAGLLACYSKEKLNLKHINDIRENLQNLDDEVQGRGTDSKTMYN
jgi:hypothetical protein